MGSANACWQNMCRLSLQIPEQRELFLPVFHAPRHLGKCTSLGNGKVMRPTWT